MAGVSDPAMHLSHGAMPLRAAGCEDVSLGPLSGRQKWGNLMQAYRYIPRNVHLLAQIAGHSFLLDAGLPASRAIHRLVARHERAGVKRDVFGHIGVHEMPLCWLPVALGGRVVHLRCGVMPPALEGFLALANVEAVLGYDLLRHYAMVLDMREGRLALGAQQ